MNDTQMELSLGSVHRAESRSAIRPPSTFTARWWFERMHQIVDRAFDWQSAPQPRPEQIWFRGTHRQVSLNS